MKTVIRRKGDLTTDQPIATIEANPLLCTGFISWLLNIEEYSSDWDSVYFNLKQLERGEIAFFTTTRYLISDTPAIAVSETFTTDKEIEV